MKLQEQAQNLGGRIATIHVVAFILLSILGVRLYYLQIVNGEYYEKRAENQRIRLIPIPAPRGAIFDRHGKILVDSRPTFNVVISNEPMKQLDIEADERIDEYAYGLNLEPDVVADRLKQIKKQNDLKRLSATTLIHLWVRPISWNIPNSASSFSRRDFIRTARPWRILGYVGEISPKQLESERWAGMKAATSSAKAA